MNPGKDLEYSIVGNVKASVSKSVNKSGYDSRLVRYPICNIYIICDIVKAPILHPFLFLWKRI